MTVQELINSAFQSLGLLAAGETLPSEHQAIAKEVLQMVADEWAAEDLLIPVETWESLTLVNGQSQYTIGTNGSPDKNSARPEDITDAFVRDSSDNDYFVEIYDERQWAGITDKTTTPTG